MQKRFALDDITEYQLEITSYCNAACPQCPRNINGGPDNPYLNVQHLSREIIDNAFTEDVLKNVKQIFFCGSYGDALMHPDLLEILIDFRTKAPHLFLYIQTNGHPRKPLYYKAIADVMNMGGGGRIDFNIDGFKDTNHIYRRNTDFDKIISNAEAFIDAGGEAVWNYIVFKHNENDVNSASTLATLMGFKKFQTRHTGRFFRHDTIVEMPSWPVVDKNMVLEYNLQLPTQIKYRNPSMLRLSDITNQKQYFSDTEISCNALNSSFVTALVNAEGLVMPCNFFNHNLYDARFHDRNVIPGANDLSFLSTGENQVQDLFERHNAKTALSIKHTSLDVIFQSPFWNEIIDSWDKKCGEGRIFECAMTCGSKIRKVWDQVDLKHKTFLITGGNRGLGLELTKHYKGVNVSRNANSQTELVADITDAESIRRIAQESLGFDVFINNAFDGPIGTQHANFAQINVLIAVYDAWKQAGKKGHIINIGSVGEKEIVSPEPSFERYRIPKAALAHASKQCTKAFEENIVPFKTSLISFDRLDTPLSRSRQNWTGNGINCNDVIKTIDYMLDTQGNTCIEEVVMRLNKEFKS